MIHFLLDQRQVYGLLLLRVCELRFVSFRLSVTMAHAWRDTFVAPNGDIDPSKTNLAGRGDPGTWMTGANGVATFMELIASHGTAAVDFCGPTHRQTMFDALTGIRTALSGRRPTMQDDEVPLAVVTAMLGILDDAVARDATLHVKLDLGISGAAGNEVIDLLFRQPQAAGAAAPASVPQVLPVLRVRVCACTMLLAEICEPVAAHRVMCRDMLRVQLLHFPPTRLSLLSVTIPFVCSVQLSLAPTTFGWLPFPYGAHSWAIHAHATLACSCGCSLCTCCFLPALLAAGEILLSLSTLHPFRAIRRLCLVHFPDHWVPPLAVYLPASVGVFHPFRQLWGEPEDAGDSASAILKDEFPRFTSRLRAACRIIESGAAGSLATGILLAESTQGLRLVIADMLARATTTGCGLAPLDFTCTTFTAVVNRLLMAIWILGPTRCGHHHVRTLHLLLLEVFTAKESSVIFPAIFPRKAVTNAILAPNLAEVQKNANRLEAVSGCPSIDLRKIKAARCGPGAGAGAGSGADSGAGAGGGGGSDGKKRKSAIDSHPCNICGSKSHPASGCDLFGLCNAPKPWIGGSLCFRCMDNNSDTNRGTRCKKAIHAVFAQQNRTPGSLVAK